VENYAGQPIKIGLFITCLVDLFRPSVASAAIKLLEEAGCVVAIPRRQVCCCGQPAYNSGDATNSRKLAMQTIASFEGFDYVVGPSGSCMALIKSEYPKLFERDPAWHSRAAKLTEKSFELVSFLVDGLGVKNVTARGRRPRVSHEYCRPVVVAS